MLTSRDVFAVIYYWYIYIIYQKNIGFACFKYFLLIYSA